MRAERPLFCAVTNGEKRGWRGWSSGAPHEAGVDAAKFSGHSRRRGLFIAGTDTRTQLAGLMRQSRHRRAQIVLGYLEPADLWRNNVTAGVLQERQEDGKETD